MVLEYLLNIQAIDMKEVSWISWRMVQEHRNSSMETYSKVNTKMANLMVMDNIFGGMDHTIKAISRMVFEVDMVYGKGKEVKVINMKVNFWTIRKKDLESIPGNVAIFTKEIIIKICAMVMVSSSGKMEVSIEASGKMIYSMAKANFLLANKSW